MNKYRKERLFILLMRLSVMIVAGSMLMIIGINVIKGGAIVLKEPGILFSPPGPRYLLGGGGGIWHAVSGSLYMVIPSTILSGILGYFAALFLQVDYLKVKVADKIRAVFDILWGVPSIIYGVFMLNLLILFGQRGSLLAAVITLTFLQLPIITRYMDEALRSVPQGIRESMYSLGSTRLEASFVTARYALPGIVAGMLLGMGRAMGDAAAVIFTAGAGNTMPRGILQSVTSLPILIFLQANSFYPTVRDHAYAASFILIVIIVLLNLASRVSARYFAKFTSGGK